MLTGAGVGIEQEAPTETTTVAGGRVALLPALWRDPDVRWLTGVHEAGGHAYLVREQYEELLWWLLMPSLLRVCSETTPSRVAVEEMSRTVEEALATAEAAGYRIDKLLGLALAPDAGETAAAEVESPEFESQTLEPEQEQAAEPEAGKPESHEPEIESAAASESAPVEPE